MSLVHCGVHVGVVENIVRLQHVGNPEWLSVGFISPELAHQERLLLAVEADCQVAFVVRLMNLLGIDLFFESGFV